MNNKRIIIINGHSVENSFCESIASEYAKSAKENDNEVKHINLYQLKFNPILERAYNAKRKQVLEKDLKNVQEGIKWADHIVFVFPVWWGDVPALMKGFFERTFIPGFAYDPRVKKMGQPKSLLTGKTARLIITMGAPILIYKLYIRKLATRLVKFNLKYCGIKPIKATHFGRIGELSQLEREKILEKVKKLGSKGQ